MMNGNGNPAGEGGKTSVSNYEMNGNSFRNTMHSLNYGNVMESAARDYMKETERDQALAGNRGPVTYDLEDLEDDPELHALHKERIQQMKEEHEKRREMERKGHGTYVDVNEGEFLPEVTSAFQVCCHFYHQEFERCRIVDKHLGILARKYFDTKFIKINAPDAPFFVDKLQIQVLPCIIFFRNGVAFDRIVGFEELGANDDFPTEKLERMLLNAGIVAVREKKEDDSEDEEETMKLERAKRITYGFTKYDSEDEDSDFD
jgi:thiol-disulfide isomerase/thioredoxin|tara:strand:+ start:3539 stop:4318 length:780 start_codon:yes stop_codon:yes gene_type:complete|mmetsp:Transcript_1631/g.6188  ORF Transcript_1631/g.6188 Transcript_1631/m.6188 type:complete len:260 (-) Transcript_1631:4058-4837(-)